MKPRILVVDDEPEAVELVEFNLKQAGYVVSTAVDGAEALKKAFGPGGEGMAELYRSAAVFNLKQALRRRFRHTGESV